MRNRGFRALVCMIASVIFFGMFFTGVTTEDVNADSTSETVKIHVKWSSLDGKKVKNDITLTVPSGTDWRSDLVVDQIKQAYQDDKYTYIGMYKKPMTDFEGYDEFISSSPYLPDHLTTDITAYAYMFTSIEGPKITVTRPVPGSTYGDNPVPVLTAENIWTGEDNPTYLGWDKQRSPDYVFKAGEELPFHALIAPKLGYVFSSEPTLENCTVESADLVFGGVYYQVKGTVTVLDFDAPSYKWSSDNGTCTATRVCNCDKSVSEKETVKTSSKVTKEPTTSSTGTKVYTATFSNAAFKTQTKTVTIPSLTPKPTDKPTPTAKPDASGVGGFVDRLYEQVLGRNADPNGKADWIDRVMTKGKTGADIALGFLFSPEFLNKNMSNGDFLEILYKVFFDRKSDPTGKQYWLDNMANGMSKEKVIWGFINSTEWANVCLRYGIPSGGTGIPNATIEPNEKVIEFATRLYTTCLGRKADEKGLSYWALELANMRVSGTKAAYGFFFSKELIDANITNEDFLMRLYRTFMGREADQNGFIYWLGKFGEGATREDVFYGFANSPEFQKICADYGILK